MLTILIWFSAITGGFVWLVIIFWLIDGLIRTGIFMYRLGAKRTRMVGFWSWFEILIAPPTTMIVHGRTVYYPNKYGREMKELQNKFVTK